MFFSDLTSDTQRIISSIFYMTIATTNSDGTPWISPVYFNYDDHCSLYWVSYKDAIHSRNVTENKKASISIYNSGAAIWEGNGVYLQCDIVVLESQDDIQRGIDIYHGGRHIPHGFDRKDVSDYVGDKPWRMYKAVPYDISTLKDGTEIDGYPIDQRVSAQSD